MMASICWRKIIGSTRRQHLLLDSAHGGQFGGTGFTFDWSRVLPEVCDRIVLAGGFEC